MSGNPIASNRWLHLTPVPGEREREPENTLPPMLRSPSDHGAAIVTRISRRLHRQLKLHCLENDMTLTSFVTGALEDHLRSSRRKAGRGRSVPSF